MAKSNVARMRQTEVEGTEAQTTETAAEKKKAGRRGKIPTMPVCVVYQDDAADKNIVASLIHPNGNRVTARGRGLNGTLGELGDAGYPVGSVSVEGPEWVQGFIPDGVKVLGFATPAGFPVENRNL